MQEWWVVGENGGGGAGNGVDSRNYFLVIPLLRCNACAGAPAPMVCGDPQNLARERP
jgi:hypothetical protein